MDYVSGVGSCLYDKGSLIKVHLSFLSLNGYLFSLKRNTSRIIDSKSEHH